ncbi:MAG TPA: immunoglobulin domain-containing protein, partial [Verrucomicrobiae bacterium]|nr:immunoglobulin domain-containing protein [Verrucomicrobiae bacterium]
THEWYIYPITGADSPAMTTSNNWIAILQGITNNLAPYHPVYVTLDYGSQYVRATHTSQPVSGSYNPASGQVTVKMTGHTDMNITAQVYLGADNSISNVALVIPQFTGQTNAAVTVTSVPLGISAQPQNVTVPAGSTATVGVAVTGNPPLTFQWEDNGTNIPNATNAFFTIGAAQFADAGAYSVLVSNATGSVLSSNAMLTVTPVQPPMLQGAVDQLSSHKMFVISFTSNPGQRYVVQYTDAPANGGWSVLTNVTATATNTVCHDPIIGWPQRFYRVLVAAVLPERVQLTGALQSGQFILAFNATTGKSYTVQYQDGLGAWTVLTNITAANTNVLLTNPIIGPQRLFQVSTPAH